MADRYDQDLLLGYVEEELSAADRADFERQLANDPQLRALTEALRADRAALRSLRTDVPAFNGEWLEEQIETLERQMLLGDPSSETLPLPTPRPARRLRQPLRWVGWLGAAAVLGLAGTAAFLTLTPDNLLRQAELFYDSSLALESSAQEKAPSPPTEGAANVRSGHRSPSEQPDELQRARKQASEQPPVTAKNASSDLESQTLAQGTMSLDIAANTERAGHYRAEQEANRTASAPNATALADTGSPSAEQAAAAALEARTFAEVFRQARASAPQPVDTASAPPAALARSNTAHTAEALPRLFITAPSPDTAAQALSAWAESQQLRLMALAAESPTTAATSYLLTLTPKQLTALMTLFGDTDPQAPGLAHLEDPHQNLPDAFRLALAGSSPADPRTDGAIAIAPLADLGATRNDTPDDEHSGLETDPSGQTPATASPTPSITLGLSSARPSPSATPALTAPRASDADGDHLATSNQDTRLPEISATTPSESGIPASNQDVSVALVAGDIATTAPDTASQLDQALRETDWSAQLGRQLSLTDHVGLHADHRVLLQVVIRPGQTAPPAEEALPALPSDDGVKPLEENAEPNSQEQAADPPAATPAPAEAPTPATATERVNDPAPQAPPVSPVPSTPDP